MPVRDFFDFNARRLKRYDKLLSRKRFIIVLVVLCLVFYFIPYLFRSFPSRRPSWEEGTIQCIDNFVRSYRSEIGVSDASFWTSPQLHETLTASATPTGFSSLPTANINELSKNAFVPYVGNGQFAISSIQDSSRHFYIMGKRTLTVPLAFDPIVNFAQFGTHPKSATVLRYGAGSLEKCTCVNYAGGVITIRETFTAHRLVSSLFTQQIQIKNPTDTPLILQLSRKGWSGKGRNIKVQPIMATTSDHRDYSIITGQIDKNEVDSKFFSFSKQSGKMVAFAIVYPALHSTIEISARHQETLVMQTFMNYTKTFDETSNFGEAAIPDLKVSLRELITKVVPLSPTVLQQQHETAWKWLWSSGFSIAHSHAPQAVNGYQINATLYYLLTQRKMHVPASFESDAHQVPLPEIVQLGDLDYVDTERASAYKPDRCYNGHSTFHASRLWKPLDSLVDLKIAMSLWYLTLEKQSCEHLLQSGATGVMQAALLSLTGLTFSTKHLEFSSHPNDLQRPFLARRVHYDNSTWLNMSVTINADNKALIHVALDRHQEKTDFYACDAGCQDAPIRLSSSISQFPVKLTQPLTSLLYVTADRQHIRELKHSIHVKEIGEAPAHEHHTIALHKYGHSLGGLPTFFWMSIFILIVVFHLFLGKMIYNEYFNPNTMHYEKVPRNVGRYSM